jgi:superfamily I DNA and/or RNA helicase
MVEDLAEISHTCFYKGRNMFTPKTSKIVPHLHALGSHDKHPITWIKHQSSTNERSCEHEAEAVINTLKALESTYTNGETKKPSVYIITFYKDQHNDLKKRLNEIRFMHIKPEVRTVDSVQGQEADIVLLCFTKYSKGSFYHVPNRLNVALTRAKSRLFVFGPKDRIAESQSPALQMLTQHNSL